MTNLPLTNLPAGFADDAAAFLRALNGKNRSAATVLAYETDLRQFIRFLEETNVAAVSPASVQRADILEFLAELSQRQVSGVSRARKLAAIREFFRFLVQTERCERSPAEAVETPHKERNVRTFLRPEEYTHMLSLAGGNVRDFAILQVFLQTGVRVSELCAIEVNDVDLQGGLLAVHGKGMATREVELERKGLVAIKNWLAVRPSTGCERLFLNKDGASLGQRGVRKLVAKYKRLAGITRKASCHSFRHTFATYKAEHGVSPFQLQRWLGHASLATTQICVHLGKQGAKKLMGETSL
jgi:site-specific recombinase XerD